jgi:hypothetical protein
MLPEYVQNCFIFPGGRKEMHYRFTDIRGPQLDIRRCLRNPVSLQTHQRKPSCSLSWWAGSNIDPGNEVRCLTS